MSTRWLASLVALATGAAVLSACAPRLQRPVTGVIVPPTESVVGARAPDFTFRTADGRLARLSDIYQDATLVAFLEKACSAPDSRLAALSTQLKNRRVAVAEICTHPERCKSHGECVRLRGEEAPDLVSLCDARGLVRRWYGVSTTDSVFVLDQNGIIRGQGALTELDGLRAQAEHVARAAARRRQRVEAYSD